MYVCCSLTNVCVCVLQSDLRVCVLQSDLCVCVLQSDLCVCVLQSDQRVCVCVAGWLYHTAPQLGDKVEREQRAISNLTKSVDLDASNGQTWYMLGRLVPLFTATVGCGWGGGVGVGVFDTFLIYHVMQWVGGSFVKQQQVCCVKPWGSITGYRMRLKVCYGTVGSCLRIMGRGLFARLEGHMGGLFWTGRGGWGAFLVEHHKWEVSLGDVGLFLEDMEGSSSWIIGYLFYGIMLVPFC